MNLAAAPAPAPEPAPAPTEASPAPAAAAVSAGTEEGNSSTGASVDVASASAETGASATSTETGAAQEGTSSETPAVSEGGEAGSGVAAAAATQGSSVSEGVSAQQQLENASAPDGAEGVNTQSANPSGSSASSDNPTSHLREIIGHLKETVDSLEQQLLRVSGPQPIAASTNAGTSSVELLTDLLLQPANSERGQADAAASPQGAGSSRADTASALAQVLEAVRIRIFASEVISSRSGDGDARAAGENSTGVQVLRREISTMQRVEALLTELEGIEFLSGGAADESEAGSARAGSGAGSGGDQADSGAASSSSVAAAAAAAAASADAERGSRHGAAATEDVEGSSSGSIGAMVEEERRSLSERLRVAIEDTIGNVLSLTSPTPSTLTREEAVMKLATEFSSPSGGRDEEEKERAAAEKRCARLFIFMLRIETFWVGIMMR